ncbi:alpha/beta hydrolase family protein [Kocuria sp.]|uniref:alpha/beta hydrolase family protein n=1 Tax=Kocuria sp. TaxID=1871328 RepID=UPI0026E003CA|nr:alpha/beta fold hydrolase [Kocuria sp.]MDO5619020.1 alpha/beta fold hydrolase [Kocuria sp.]
MTLKRRDLLRGAGGLVVGGVTAVALTTAVPSGTAQSRVVAGHRRAGKPVDRGRVTWGQDEQRQTGWLYVPDPAAWSGGSRTPTYPVAVVIHGGSWSDDSDPSYMADVAIDLARYGLAVWAPTYRGLDGPGGWPQTFEDVSDAVDYVAQLAGPGRFEPDLQQVHLLGHSAGGHLATWAAGRYKLPEGAPGAQPLVNAASVTSMAGLYDLALAEELDNGDLVESLMGGVTAQEDPQRYNWASPINRLPMELPVNALHGTADTVIPLEAVEGFLNELEATQNPGVVEVLAGVDHTAWTDVLGQPWARARQAFLDCVVQP